VDAGCWFVEFKTEEDVIRATERNGTLIGDAPVEVARHVGMLTSNSGQKFALNARMIGRSKSPAFPSLKQLAVQNLPEHQPEPPSFIPPTTEKPAIIESNSSFYL